MWTRRSWVWVVAIAVALGCASEKRQEMRERAGRAAQGAVTPTREMSEKLTQDVRASEIELHALQDSIYRLVGDSVSVLMKRAEDSWRLYRKEECDALRLDFAHGSVAPVAQMECWVELTDDRRRFLDTAYSFALPPRQAAPARSR